MKKTLLHNTRVATVEQLQLFNLDWRVDGSLRQRLELHGVVGAGEEGKGN